MNNKFELKASVRAQTGKSAARKIRQNGDLPAILYGKDFQAMPLITCPKNMAKILQSPLKRNSLIELSIEDNGKVDKKHVMVRDLQADLIKRNLTHIDFMLVDPNAPVTVNVPLNLEGKSKAVTAGGKLEQVRKSIGVRCLPSKIPAQIVLDVTDLEFGSTLTRQVRLGDDLKLADDPNYAVVTIRQPRTSAEEADADKKAEAAKPAAAKAAPAKAPEKKDKK